MSISTERFRLPVDPRRTRVTSSPGPRQNPTNRAETQRHQGIDAAPLIRGDQLGVYAAAEGIVVFGGFNTTGGLGNAVVIDHGTTTFGDHIYSISGHLARIGGGIRVGDTVSRGQYLGEMGTTGHSTGTHLHFSLIIATRPIASLPRSGSGSLGFREGDYGGTGRALVQYGFGELGDYLRNKTGIRRPLGNMIDDAIQREQQLFGLFNYGVGRRTLLSSTDDRQPAAPGTLSGMKPRMSSQDRERLGRGFEHGGWEHDGGTSDEAGGAGEGDAGGPGTGGRGSSGGSGDGSGGSGGRGSRGRGSGQGRGGPVSGNLGGSYSDPLIAPPLKDDRPRERIIHVDFNPDDEHITGDKNAGGDDSDPNDGNGNDAGDSEDKRK